MDTKFTWIVEGAVPADQTEAFQSLWRQAFSAAKENPDSANGMFSTPLSATGEEPATHYFFRMPMKRDMLYEAMLLVAGRIGRQAPVGRGQDPDAIMVSPSVGQFLQALKSRDITVRIRRNDRGDNATEIDGILQSNSLVRIEPSINM